MIEIAQLTIPGTPKKRGGRRPGAGRPKTQPKTKMLRVCIASAEVCKQVDRHYRQMLTADDAAPIQIETVIDDFLCGPGHELSPAELKDFAVRLLAMASRPRCADR